MPRLHKLVAKASVPVLLALLCANQPFAQPSERKAESQRAIEYLLLRESDYLLKLEQNFSGITQLGYAVKKGEMRELRNDALLSLAAHYISYGSYSEASGILEQVRAAGMVSPSLDQLTLDLARLYYARGDYEKSEKLLKKMAVLPVGNIRNERDFLLANVYVATKRDSDAISLLTGMRDDSVWSIYGKYNLAVLLISKGQVHDGMAILSSISEIKGQDSELNALRDRANLLLGTSYLDEMKLDLAKKVLLRIPGDSPYYNKALLLLGWVDKSQGQLQGAVKHWEKIAETSFDDALHQARLISAYSWIQLKDYKQAESGYRSAIKFYEKEIASVDNAINAIERGNFVQSLFAEFPQDAAQGWNRNLRNLPDNSAMPLILPLMASHDFQAALKLHRDLLQMEQILNTWDRDLEAFASLVQARDNLFRDKLPRSLSFNKQYDLIAIKERVQQLKKELERIEAEVDVFALADEEEMKLLVRVRRSEKLLRRLVGEILDAEDLQIKYSLLRGLLYWNLHSGFKDKLVETKKAVAELEQAVDSAIDEQAQLRQAAKDSAYGAGSQGNTIRELRVRQRHLISLAKDLLVRSDANMKSRLKSVLLDQRAKINGYQLQAQFGLAQSLAYVAAGDKSNEKGEVIAAFRKLLSTQGELPNRSKVERYLAELELEQADLNLLRSSEADEKRKADKLSEDDRQISYQDVIRRYLQILEKYPNDPENELLLYQLAKAYDRDGDLEGSLDTLSRLVKKYPNSNLRDEVQFRRGEMLFSINSMADAAQAYASVIAMGEKSAFYEGSVYKHGWSQYRLGEYDKALASFMDLLDLKLGIEAQGDGAAKKLSKHDAELVNDLFRIASLSLSAREGPQTLVKIFAARGHRAYEYRIYEKLAEHYLEQERIQDAADTYRAYVKTYPSDPHSPEFQSKIVVAYKNAKFTSLLLTAKEQFVLDYVPDSGFWEKNPQLERAPVQADVKTYLQELSSHHHALAQASKRSEDYARAEKWYRLFLKSFPQDENAAKTNFLLAELLFESGRHNEAAAEYDRTAYVLPSHDKGAEAGYAAILAYQQQALHLTGEAKDAMRRRAVESSLRFAEKYPSDTRANAALIKAAEEAFDMKDSSQAVEIARLVVDRKSAADVVQRRSAWTIIAHSQFDKTDYAGAEASYKELLQLVDKGDQQYGTLLDRLAASVYKQGEKAQADKDLKLAVRHYMRVGEVAAVSAIRPTAEYDAAAVLMTMKDWKAAIRVLENFQKMYAEHALQKEVPAKLAVAYQEDGQYLKAAAEMELLARTAAQDELRREAMLQAADLYSKVQNLHDATRVYEEYVRQYPRPLVQAVEVRQRIADYYSREKNVEAYRNWLHEIIAADRDGGTERTERTQYLAAMASLVLAAVAYEEYSQVRLVEPLETNLKIKKEKMETALAAYSRAGEYNAAEIATASTYNIAQIYADFGRELLNSERPQNLSEEELEQYNILLEEQANPFEEKAIEFFEANARLAADDIYDEWVKKSYSALRRLMPARYDKVEQGEIYVDSHN